MLPSPVLSPDACFFRCLFTGREHYSEKTCSFIYYFPDDGGEDLSALSGDRLLKTKQLQNKKSKMKNRVN